MTTVSGNPLRPSPWLSVWLRPRDTIERILATNPRHHVLLLAGLGTASEIMSKLIDTGLTTELLDWRVIAAVAFVSATTGAAVIYVSGLFFKWSGKMLGGRASPAKMRAVLAWGLAPTVVSLAICLIALIALKLFGSEETPESASRRLTSVLQLIAAALGLWSLIATMLMLARVQGFGFWRTLISFGVGSLSVWIVFVTLALVIRTFVVEPFNMPSGSMQPTLLVGDYLYVSKFSYGYSRYSLPWGLPLVPGRILFTPPRRGDVVVFTLARDNRIDYIKRIVGLPGDRVQVIHGLLHINGQPVKVERTDDFVAQKPNATAVPLPEFVETLPNGARHRILKRTDEGALNNTQVYVVPPDHYFVMGDNRDNSLDSRVPPEAGGVGFVPAENLVGRGEFLYFSIDRVSQTSHPAIRFERIGMTVQ